MIEQSVTYPVAFYLGLGLLVIGIAVAWSKRQSGTGIPMLAVLGTVAIWYFGDALYNEYQVYAIRIGPQYLESAWLQVVLFLTAFILLVPMVHRSLNRRLLGERSEFFELMSTGGIENTEFQRRLTIAMSLLAGVWFILMLIALIRTNFDFLGLFAPYISGKTNPWARGRLGGGIDAVLSFANYVQIMITAMFGIIAAISKNKRTRSFALVCFALAAPFYILDRARNVMLATCLPGLLAWVLLRLKGGIILKASVLAGSFAVIEAWMRFVIDSRSQANISLMVSSLGVGGVAQRMEEIETEHKGLTMFQELSWINSFIDKGTYAVNWGQRYLADLANPIPRVIWPDKPMIGIDYAIARGQTFAQASEANAGVGATISTGMIGQGVVNFGVFFGPIFAAFLMACWVAILARQDLMGEKMGRMLLFFIGCVLTFNLGRDITFITLYPFIFGYILLTVWARTHGER